MIDFSSTPFSLGIFPDFKAFRKYEYACSIICHPPYTNNHSQALKVRIHDNERVKNIQNQKLIDLHNLQFSLKLNHVEYVLNDIVPIYMQASPTLILNINSRFSTKIEKG